MKFLVILACLLINHYWRKERALDGDAWYVSFCDSVQGQLRGDSVGVPAALARLALFIGVPLLVLALLLWLTDNVLLGFISLGLHVLVLLLAFDRLSMPFLAEEYLRAWRAGNYESAYNLLQQRLSGRFGGRFDNYTALHHRFCDLLLGSYFERLFAVVFWYLLLGPSGALGYTLIRLYSVSLNENGAGTAGSQIERPEAGWLAHLLVLLEWVPARLLALTFSLAGDFVAAFAKLRAGFFSTGRGVELVRASAVAALGQGSARLQPVAILNGTSVSNESHGAEEMEACSVWAARQVEALLGLMTRSQIIWVTAIALLTLYGVD